MPSAPAFNFSVPFRFDRWTFAKFARRVLASVDLDRSNTVVFDFDRLSFIRPIGVVLLSNIVYLLASQGFKVHFRNASRNSLPLLYLDDALFFERHMGEKIRSSASPRATTQPLQRIDHPHIHGWLKFTLVPWLASRLFLTEASLAELSTCIAELFNNINDHAQLDSGSIFVQQYPRENRITIAVSDVGPGLPNVVRRRCPDLDDDQAIVQAVQEGFTTLSRPTNRGVGLDYLLRTAVVANGGTVTIYSQRAIVEFTPGTGTAVPRLLACNGLCPGTTFEIDLRTDTIENRPEESEDLLW